MANRLELIYSVKELLKDHTDDTLISDRHILYLFRIERARFLRQLYSNITKELDTTAMQTMCVAMEPVDRGVCGIETECFINRSKVRLPNLLSLHGRTALISASPAVIGVAPFDIIDRYAISVSMNDPYATNSVFLDDGYLYLVGPTPAVNSIECIRVTGIFDNPDDLEAFKDCCNCDEEADPCMTDQTNYPIPGNLIPDISQAVLNAYLTTANLTSTRDVEGDSVPQKVETQRRGRR